MTRKRSKIKTHASDLHGAYELMLDRYNKVVTSYINARTFNNSFASANGKMIQDSGLYYGGHYVKFSAHCTDVPRRHNQPKGTIKSLKAHCIKTAIARVNLPIEKYIQSLPATTLGVQAATVPLGILPYVFHMTFDVTATIKGFFDDEYIYPLGMMHQYDKDGHERRALSTRFETTIHMLGFDEGVDLESMRGAIALIGS